jgi:transposase InsO family protein
MNEKKETGSPCCVNGRDQGHAPCEEPGEGEERQNGRDAEAKERVAFGPPEDLPNTLEHPIRLRPTSRGRRLVKPEDRRPQSFKPEQRLLILDTWKRSGLSAADFAPLVGVSKHSLRGWRKRFEELGPGGLVDQGRGGPRGSRLPELTRRAILMIKEANPDYGCQRISDMLVRGPGLGAGAGAVAKVLHEAGYELEEVATHPHPDQPRRFERARPNQMWQSDLFTFTLKRQNRRVYLVAFLDDRSRFVTGYGLWASSSAALVIETLRAAVAAYGPLEEILTDNGPQYVTWRGKSAFSKELDRQGIRHLVSRPKHPQTLGKVERFWGTLWRECLERAVFVDLEEARRRVGLFIDGYNFHRPHTALEGLVPADVFFGAAPEVLATLKARVAANAMELARSGIPREPFYLTGQVGGKSFSVHAAGERVFMTAEGQEKQEIDLAGGGGQDQKEQLPEPLTPSAAVSCQEAPEDPSGFSSLDEGLLAAVQGREDGQEGGER